MKNDTFVYTAAKQLISQMSTLWDEYDFNEKSTKPNERVPKLQLNGIERYSELPMEEKEEELKREEKQGFVRSYQVKYHGITFQVDIVTKIQDDMVKGYQLDVYHLHEGCCQKLFSENL